MQGNTKVLVHAPESKLFWVHTGPALRNLVDLRDILPGLKESIFKFHVNESKNDFANWIGEVLGEVDLANKLQKIKSKRYTVKTLNTYLLDSFGM
ncbi:MAG: hypothetical protein ACD_52C00242G0001 [uncultured bacterium]|nr:MAG: hypothetical protein ACD_52C00242G0001 [uncultured bacterium]